MTGAKGLFRTVMWLPLLVISLHASAEQTVKIGLSRGTERERATKTRLEQVLASYDLSKYTFTRDVVIEEGTQNHAFPVLTLNAGFAYSSHVLAAYVHEQIHWHLRERDASQRRAVTELRRMYPGAPVGPPDGAESTYSTYGHLVTCFLEVQTIRTLLGPEEAAAVIGRKRYYRWIYKTVLSDEARIGLVVRRQSLGID